SDSSSFPSGQRWRVGLLVPWCVVVTGLWPLAAGVVTPDPRADRHTMAAWKSYEHNTPILSWLGYFWRGSGVPGLLLCVVAPVLVLLVVRRPGARAWGVEVRTWAWAYPAYLFVAAAPGPSIIRYLLLAFPLLWPVPDLLSSPRSASLQRLGLPLLAVGGLLLQWVWISHFV